MELADMKSILQLAMVLGFCGAAAASAQERIGWAPDYPTACKVATEQNRLILLHFYSDDCPPCRIVEAEVFTQPAVAAAINRNYVPLKVHVLQAPELAKRYQIDRWPTDVIVTPAGLELQRSGSPQSAERYIQFVDAVAIGSGTAARQWANNMQQVGQSTLGQTAEAANVYTNQAQQQWGKTVSQYAAAADQARNNTMQAGQQAQNIAGQYGQQLQAGAQQYQQQAGAAVQQYQQQAAGAAQQVQQQAAGAAQQWNNQLAATGQQVQQQAAAAGNQFQAAAQQFGDSTRTAVDQFASANGAANLQSPAYSPTPQAGPSVAPPAYGAVGAYGQGQAAPPVGSPTQNPWIAASPPVGAAASAFAGAATPQPAKQSAAAPSAGSGSNAKTQFISAAQAPPVAIDGYCPVTLLERTAKNPKDSTAWRKGDPQFGAIHLGRTYLFASAAEQQKFLANPDAYSPVLSGYDPVQFAAKGALIEGQRKFGITFNNRLFLFADEASRTQFESNPNGFAQPAYQAMQRSETGGVYR
jgi:thiol-disulfide isomerase/thioredoxin